MNILLMIFKRILLWSIFTVVGIYFLFISLPFIINPFLPMYTNKISKMTDESCGLKLKFDKLQLITTTDLSVGLRLGYFSAALPNGEEFISAKNITAKLTTPSLRKKELDVENFGVEDIYATLNVKPNGELEIIDFLPESNKKRHKKHFTSLPLGFKLSNKLNKVYIREYMLTLVSLKDRKEYTVQGGNLTVNDFVLDKDVKIKSVGIAKIDDEFRYADNGISDINFLREYLTYSIKPVLRIKYDTKI